MKKTHIIGIVVIAIALCFLFGMLGNSSTYADFQEAKQLGPDKVVHVAGQWVRNKPTEYDPETDPNRFSFYLKDKKGVEHRVVFLKPKPADFERTPQIVAIGSMKGEDFIADEILMKCPSKYNDGRGEMAQN
jgi:cytochrome c-type biogenesis protein CcmE